MDVKEIFTNLNVQDIPSQTAQVNSICLKLLYIEHKSSQYPVDIASYGKENKIQFSEFEFTN